MNPKISIIVPVYKVEPYIHKCVDSILAQTFTNFELILVDDGSPDNCGKICDDYEQKDCRVKVIHKENGGQATARNAALDIARGDYIGFVDSDDWIEPDMYELLYGMCTKNNCEISSCTMNIYYKDKMIINGTHPLTIHNKSQAMEAIIKGDLYDEVVWTKLFKRELLEGMRFPVGIMYEDTAFTYKVIHKVGKVCCIGAPKYNYLKHDNSTMDRARKNISLDAIYVYEDMYKFIQFNYPYLIDLVVLKLANNCMRILNLILNSNNFEKYKKNYYKVGKILNSYFDKTVKLEDYPRNVKILLIVNKIHPTIYKFIIKKYQP
ncbi:glycosyltransferase family 2 protein [Clostridium grantii]|uniref:Glycosyltransferase involved in cell wall bisynthesis n=1 Tax=Clostridium grantii DSM 8605 TaxID=1121316 RepID=A0A1M5V0C9_9CLOT|nr:glycosyltransferase [Clostridium grantii]SHH68403.1 Glycosyltransferase involved in cell wall bisynthesis [Clostridium grantii DSM 8605]